MRLTTVRILKCSGRGGLITEAVLIKGVVFRQGSTVSLFVLDPTGLCAHAGRKVASFGQSISSGCLLRLAYENFNDCDYLRYCFSLYLGKSHTAGTFNLALLMHTSHSRILY